MNTSSFYFTLNSMKETVPYVKNTNLIVKESRAFAIDV